MHVEFGVCDILSKRAEFRLVHMDYYTNRECNNRK